MITRLTMPSRAVSAPVLLRRTRASEIAAGFEVTTATHFYPNGYTQLTQRLVSRLAIIPIRVTITGISALSMKQDVWPAACTRGTTSNHSG